MRSFYVRLCKTFCDTLAYLFFTKFYQVEKVVPIIFGLQMIKYFRRQFDVGKQSRIKTLELKTESRT